MEPYEPIQVIMIVPLIFTILFSIFHRVISAGQLVQGGAVLQVPQHAPGQHQQRGGAAGARGEKYFV